MKDLYTENFKTLVKDIEEDTNKMKAILHHLFYTIHTSQVKMV